jgi:hypothetical protein
MIHALTWILTGFAPTLTTTIEAERDHARQQAADLYLERRFTQVI